MRNVALFLAGALAATAVATALAQPPDFSGSWQLDRDASVLPQRPEGGGRGIGRLFGRGEQAVRGPAETLVVTQTSDTLFVEQRREDGSQTLRYRLDGSSSVNPMPRGELTTTSRWDGATIVTEGTQDIPRLLRDISIPLTERRSLSADGRTMTVESTRSMPFGDIAVTLVYRKELR